jgi:NAD(P)H-dependent flavin oxidoreductase YrpB (nitropropane dioxygenase family)
MDRGAYGIRVGSRFALCDESGMRRDLKDQVIERNAHGETEVVTDKRASPTGYPFKYVSLPNTLADRPVYEQRRRICNRGYLLQSHFETLPDGTVKETYLCPGMPAQQHVRLGGAPEDLADRVCLCNALLSTPGFFTDAEPPLVTLGASGKQVEERHTACDVVAEILTSEYVATMEHAPRVESH